MTEIVWLMDVDGVLNCFDYPDPLVHADFNSFVSEPGYLITYSPSLMKRISDLHHDGVVTVKWLTTWQSTANLHLRERLGFGEDLEVEGGDCDMGVFYEDWWKLPIAEEATRKYDRVIWTDDELSKHFRGRAQTFVAEQDRSKLLAIAPSPCLTHKDLDTIESWINS